MHNHPLHRRVNVECLCCHVEAEFTFVSLSDHEICKCCVRHQGDSAAKANQRYLDHVRLWQSELAVAREEHAEEVARLRAVIEQRDQELARQQTEINDLQAVVRAGVENAPLAAVEQWWANEQVSIAAEKRNVAYRSRDHAYRALWALERLHHEDEDHDGHCICGKRADRRAELEALASVVEAVARWENNQIDRLFRDLPHGLPDEHPEVRKRGGWSYRHTWWSAG